MSFPVITARPVYFDPSPELGVFAKGGYLPEELYSHLEALIAMEVLEPVIG